MTQSTSRGMAPKQAAHYLGISEQTLRKQRSGVIREGRMPLVPFGRAGRRIIYLVEDLDQWLEARGAKQKSSEPDRAAAEHVRSASETIPAVLSRGAK